MPQPLAFGLLTCFGVFALVALAGLAAIVRMFVVASQVGPPQAHHPESRLDAAARRLGLEVTHGDPATSVPHLGDPRVAAAPVKLEGRRDALAIAIELGPQSGSESLAVLTSSGHLVPRSDHAKSTQMWGYLEPGYAARATVSGPIALPPFEITIRPLPGEVDSTFAQSLGAIFTGRPVAPWRHAFVPVRPRLGALAPASFGDPELDAELQLFTHGPGLGPRIAPAVREMRRAFFEELSRGVQHPDALAMNPFCPHLWGYGSYLSLSMPDRFAARVLGAGQLDGLIAIARAHAA